jgi:anthranilate synthase component 2
MTVLIVDNYDSFTYNLYQYLGELGAEVRVVRNDEIDLAGIRSLSPSHVVISPGPGTPENPRDFGVSSDVIRELSERVPTLGVCLGHQGIVFGFGGRVIRAPKILHGKTSIVRHDRKGLFAGLPDEIEVMRYHSLIGERSSMPACLEIAAETVGDGIVMGVRHRERPLHGIQFHPESIGTPHGKAILKNFLGEASRVP